MNIVIDANIIAGYFQESVLGLNPKLTEKATYIVERLDNQDHVYLDKNGNVQHEWESLVEPEWFSAWFTDLLIYDKASIIAVDSYNVLCRALGQLGFPRNTRDIWYIRTAKAISNNKSIAYIISEDIDFFDPSKKCSSSSYRLNILKNKRGPICKYLKRENISVNSIHSYLKTV